MSNWKYYNNHKFTYREDYNDLNSASAAWVGHVYFAYDLVRNINPELIVELGTHNGTSFYSFLEALKDNNSKSIACAVDSLEGDEHAGTSGTGYDPDECYNLVKSIVRKFYPEQNARLMKMFFEEALKEFEDKSVNLLHIDGLHTYEAVKNDYETWVPKLADDSIILFHDIAVADFGVWKLWEQVKQDYAKGYTFEFVHSYGLGVAIKGDRYLKLFESMIQSPELFADHYKFQAQLSTYENDILNQRKLHEDAQFELQRCRDEKDLLNTQLTATREQMNNVEVHNTQVKNQLDDLASRKLVKIYRKFVRTFGRDI